MFSAKKQDPHANKEMLGSTPQRFGETTLGGSGGLDEKICSFKKHAEERKAEVEQLRKEVKKRRIFAKTKQLVLLDRWEPQLLEGVLAFLSGLEGFFSEVSNLVDELGKEVSKLVAEGAELSGTRILKALEDLRRLPVDSFRAPPHLRRAAERIVKVWEEESRWSIWRRVVEIGCEDICFLWLYSGIRDLPKSVSDSVRSVVGELERVVGRLGVIERIDVRSFADIGEMSQAGRVCVIPTSDSRVCAILRRVKCIHPEHKPYLFILIVGPKHLGCLEELFEFFSAHRAPNMWESHKQFFWKFVLSLPTASPGSSGDFGIPEMQRQEGFRLLQELVREKKSRSESWVRLLWLWYRFCTEVLRLQIEPKVRLTQDNRLEFGFDEGAQPPETRQLFESHVRCEAYRPEETGFPGGQLVRIDGFLCVEFPPAGGEKLRWIRSVGRDCPPEVLEVASLPDVPSGLKGEFWELLKNWKKVAEKLQFSSTPNRKDQFQRESQRLCSIVQDDSAGFESDFHELVTRAFGLCNRQRDDIARKWYEALRKYAGLETYPRVEEGGRLFWPIEKDLDYENLNLEFDFSRGTTLGDVIECERFATTPQRAKCKISLGERPRPNSMMFGAMELRGLMREIPTARELSEWASLVFRATAVGALRGRNPEVPEEEALKLLKNGLERVIDLQKRDRSKADKILEVLRVWARPGRIEILPKSLQFSHRVYHELPEDARAYCRFEFCDSRACGQIRVERLGLELDGREVSRPEIWVSAGSKPRQYDELLRGFQEARLEDFEQELMGWCNRLGAATDPEGELIKLAEDLYRKVSEGKASGRIEVSDDVFLVLKKFLKTLGFDLREPKDDREARDPGWVESDTFRPEPGANTFDVLSPALFRGDRCRVPARVRWRRD